MAFDLQPCSLETVRDLCTRFHGYGSAGGVAVYAWAVFEDGLPVAAYSWQPPPPGAAKAICPEAPQAVLSLSRMVAVPKESRRLKHVSKPLRQQMRRLIDRTRWPVLTTFSDEGQGHNGYVYQCSGWQPTTRTQVATFEDSDGQRTSRYANGVTGGRGLKKTGTTWIQRWEHWACKRGDAKNWMLAAGWKHTPIPGKVWRSGSQAYRWERKDIDEG